MIEYIPIISSDLAISLHQVKSTIELLEGGATVPFIARYRKDMTQSLDEIQIEKIKSLHHKYSELQKRKQTILETITDQGKLTSTLADKIKECWDANFLEDLYLPYKPKRKTKASTAKEKGLEPLALWILNETPANLTNEAKKYLNKEVPQIEDALQGARDIIAEIINENASIRNILRHQFTRNAVLYSKMVKGKDTEALKYKDYFSYHELLSKCPSHRLLAVLRGENEGYLKVSIIPDEEYCIDLLSRQLIKRNTESSEQIWLALKDAYKRLLAPSIETECRNEAKSKADDAAIQIFAQNARQLLLAPPLGNKNILAIDPGFRSGCKVVCLDENGKLKYDTVIYPHEPQREIIKSNNQINQLIATYKVEAIAIGNGTAGRETEDFIRNIPIDNKIEVYMVNENGASIYSASPIAREEFPDKDLTVRGAVSIGRRLADPLAELVKIDPQSIGVGQYQHDVDQNKLKESLDSVVTQAVNQVGVNLNTASKSLLTYVSGLNEKTAQNIIEYRNANGGFVSRAELKKVPRLGEKAFEQCAGFLRIPYAKNILDTTAVHPESYFIVEKMAKDQTCTVKELITSNDLKKNISKEKYITDSTGLHTIQDILAELDKPGRDPREILKPFAFANIKSVEDLFIGMVVPGIVTNITQFGCFVDIGVKQDGMVHKSQMADKYVSDPNTVVKLSQKVIVKILELDMVRKRISLSMKEVS